ncbi:erythromycin esterase family protein [uncultured Kordia sp.]|uniref:erythromycin esterase family protein n=1 Tax=uncultured Kordia sp. TaxID=507699 RepID=UPI00260AC4B0|nr:erythromycin esterase family protein [uncultured Kordia sp.]
MKNTDHLFFSILITVISFTSVSAQILSKKNIAYIKENAKNIAVDTNYVAGHWEPVLEQVKDKRIVLLGELNHGVKENFIVRNDLIKFLYKKAGFDVILFEAGIGEVFVVDSCKSKLHAKTMTYSLIWQWQNQEILDLFSFVKSNNISVAGFDIQRGFGGFFDKIFIEESRKKNIDTLLYKNIENQFIGLKKELANRKTVYENVLDKTMEMIVAYQKIHALLQPENNKGFITKELAFTLKTIENRIDFLRYMLQFAKDKNYNKRWEARDLGMANNVKWLIENIYKNRKIIIIAHNFHISNHNEQEEVMGEFLKRELGDEMYSIGAFIGAGTYWQSGKENKFKPINESKLDIKHIIKTLSGRVHFIDVPTKISHDGKWLQEKILVNDSFLNLSGSNELIISKWFDGIILIDKSTIPTKYQ